jgi:hypothetical protein
MNLHDFGLWFKYWDHKNDNAILWSQDVWTTHGSFHIIYDSIFVGLMHYEHGLCPAQDTPYLVKIRDGKHTTITKDIFEIVPNPDYKG